MARTTLLDVVQEVLSAMDSDQVNSIMDTFESEQVVSIARAVYRDMVSNRNWPFFRRTLQFNSLASTGLPTHMTLQDEIKELIFVNYDTARATSNRNRYETMVWLEPDEFLRRLNQLNDNANDVEIVIDPTGIELAIQVDKPPQFYTSFDDQTIVFDSFDRAVDDTLQSSKIQALGYIMPSFTESDTWEIDLPRDAISAYIAEVKSTCFVDLKQQVNEKAEATARRQQAWLSRKDWRANGGIIYPNYGRRGRKGYNRFGNPFDRSSYIGRTRDS